jgi:hypothetical protein
MDMANDRLSTPLPVLMHQLYQETQHATLPRALEFHPDAIILGSHDAPPLSYHDVYIDDFISIAQPPLQERMMCSLLRNIDAIFDNTLHPPLMPGCLHFKARKRRCYIFHPETHSGLGH